ncbi:hypothetical protein Tco_1507552 [Tanacetum coccineum]
MAASTQSCCRAKTLGPERQPDVAAGALEAAADAPVDDEGGQAVSTPIQAPQPPPPLVELAAILHVIGVLLLVRLSDYRAVRDFCDFMFALGHVLGGYVNGSVRDPLLRRKVVEVFLAKGVLICGEREGLRKGTSSWRRHMSFPMHTNLGPTSNMLCTGRGFLAGWAQHRIPPRGRYSALSARARLWGSLGRPLALIAETHCGGLAVAGPAGNVSTAFCIHPGVECRIGLKVG